MLLQTFLLLWQMFFGDLGNISLTRKVTRVVKNFMNEKVDIHEVVFTSYEEVVKAMKLLAMI